MQEINGIFTRDYKSSKLHRPYSLFQDEWTISDEDIIYRELLVSGNLKLKLTEKPYEEQLTRWNDEDFYFIITVPSFKIKGPRYKSVINVRTINSEEHSNGLIDFLTKGGFREVLRISQEINTLPSDKYGIQIYN